MQRIINSATIWQPLDEVAGFGVRPGYYNINGAMEVVGGVNFTIHTHDGTYCELCLFRRTEDEPYAILPFPEHYRIGNVYSMIVFGLDIEEFEYAYRVDGPYDEKKGMIFDRDRFLLDPYAKAVTGQSVWGKKPEEGTFYKARVVRDNFDWGNIGQPLIPMEDLIIYEMHVRGFTKDASSGVSCPGTFAGILEKVPYLKKLGVNAVELMPIFEFDELADRREVDGNEVINYWGYNTVSFFSPNTSYSSSVEYNREGTELKRMIKELNDNGIEVILDVVFNHTAEGNEKGPFFSFKGFDNKIYYMLTPDGKYYNFSGCGNTLNCNHPIVQQMILECLRYWVTTYRVDGFRFDLASILGRNEDGSPMASPPLLQSLAFDPILGKVKLIAEAWDAGGLYQVGSFPAWNRWAEWNGRYRDDMRRFLKGDEGLTKAAGIRMMGSPDMYLPESRGQNASINFLNCHDGFTLYDMYAYNEKHNEANGWGNTDGANDNNSWNCGVEGETDEEEVNALRKKLCRNAFAALMLSRGTPMFYAGDEFLNTQWGNNNAYCQDNRISWLDWNRLQENQDMFEFARAMIAFRKRHPVIRKNMNPCSLHFPMVSMHTGKPWDEEIEQDNHLLGIMYAGRDDKGGKDDIVFVALNAYWEENELELPDLFGKWRWKRVVDTAQEKFKVKEYPGEDRKIMLQPRSLSIFVTE